MDTTKIVLAAITFFIIWKISKALLPVAVLFVVYSLFFSSTGIPFLNWGKVEKFEILPPPQRPVRPPHWNHNFATKAHLHDQVIHVDKSVNNFPNQKPPSTWEKTLSGPFDVSRDNYVPRMEAVTVEKSTALSNMYDAWKPKRRLRKMRG